MARAESPETRPPEPIPTTMWDGVPSEAMRLTIPSARLSRHRIRRASLPEPWPEHPIRQLLRWSTEMDAFLAEVRESGRSAWTLDLWGHGPIVVFTSEEARRVIIQGTADDFGHANDVAAFFVGPSSLLLLDGDPHARARRRTMQAISGEGLASYGREMVAVADAWVDALVPGQTTPVLDAAQRMTLDILMRAVFGMRPGPEYDEVHGLARALMKNGRSAANNVASLLLPAATMRRIVLGPRDEAMNLLPEPWPLRLLGAGGGARVARELVDRLASQVRRRRERLDDGGTDAVARILRLAADQGEQLEDAQIVDEALTLLLAGHDTTAVGLAWLLLRLAERPSLWGALRDELHAAYGDGAIDPRSIGRQPLLAAAVQESLRLDGLNLGVMRRTRRDLVIDGHSIPSGTLVNAQVRHEHLSAERFDAPLDFRPERWIEKRVGPLDFAPFGGGYRRCVGAAFATYEMQVLAAAVVRRAELRAPKSLEVKRVQYGLFPGPSNEIPLTVLRVEGRG